MDIHGMAEPRFEAVRTAFEANFRQHDEVGAAVCVYHQGRVVVDLWGGIADQSTGRPWAEDTIVTVFSTTKGATAACANLLVERGELDLDAPVVQYWPEFGQAGKEHIPVRWLLCHKAGLAALNQPLSLHEACAWEPVVRALETQTPNWTPGEAHGYHAVTYGHLVGEVVRRISGSSLGAFFRTQIAEPAGIDFQIGLPEQDESRVAPLIQMALPLDSSQAPEGPGGDQLRLLANALSLSGALGGDAFTRRELRAAEFPAANGMATARGVARLYASLIGDVDGVRLIKPDTLEAARTIESQGPDKVLVIETRFGLGFMLHAPFTPLGSPRSFGHPGAGGSVGWADPEAGLAIGYVMNKMQMNLSGDPRMTGLISSAYAALG